MWQELLQRDQELFLFLNGLGSTSWDAFWLFITNKWGSLPLYGFLLMLSLIYFRWKKTLVILIFIALMITCTDQMANFFKYGVQRLRPCYQSDIFEVMRLVKHSCGGKFGYFSAHASNAMAVATFFAVVLKSRNRLMPYFLIVWALTVGYSRIYVGVHYPADVLTGFLVGLLFGWLFAKLAIFTVQKFSV